MRVGIFIVGIILLVIGALLFITAQQTVASGLGYSVTVANQNQQIFGAGLGILGLIVTIVGAAAEGD